MNALDSPCFLEANKPQTLFRHTPYCDPKCPNCHAEFKDRGRNSRVVRTTTNFPRVGIDHMFSCVKCAKTYKEMLNAT